MQHTDEEIYRFVEENRDLIEAMMDRAEGRESFGMGGYRDCRGREDDYRRPSRFSDYARRRAAEDFYWARERAMHDRMKCEDSFRTAFDAFNDPEVQKYFMTMGMNFMMGMSALIQKMPGPEIMKNAASGMEDSWKEASRSAPRQDRAGADDGETPGRVPIKFESDGERSRGRCVRRPRRQIREGMRDVGGRRRPGAGGPRRETVLRV